jgi:hypothetical protein
MRGPAYHQRPRSLGAQAARMRGLWPEFEFEARGKLVRWTGPLRGFQRRYIIDVYWEPASTEKPYVVLSSPSLRPREGSTFEQIPHLVFWEERPELSALCLFDPAGNEWSNKLLIADTTIKWAAEWLFYYELWHFDGTWRGTGVGPENIAEARAAAIYRETGELAEIAP